MMNEDNCIKFQNCYVVMHIVNIARKVEFELNNGICDVVPL